MTHEIWHASIKKGGYSSRHTHDRKPNLFYVASGTMLVHTFHNNISTIPSSTFSVSVGQQITIVDGVWHQFEATTDVELIEVYWVYLKGEDIQRADEGGLRP
jgi:mannose-6-phosphate isomerase-like protein (cupin superfamily)